VRAAAAVAVLAALLASTAGAATTRPSFVFGRYGGNIIPTTIRIAATGRVSVDGARRGTLAQTKLRALLAVAVRERFFALPKKIVCPGQLPDFATLYVTVRDGTRIRTVTDRGNCHKRFLRVYVALQSAVKASA
jgi:hypothetical protein